MIPEKAMESAAMTVALIAARWPVPAWTKIQMDLWARLLVDLDQDVLGPIVQQFMLVGDKPDLSNLRREMAARSLKAPDAGHAWQEVQRLIIRVGSRGTVLFSHPVLADAVERFGGWVALCRAEGNSYDRSAFQKAYQAALEAVVVERAAAPGAGFPPVVEIGWKERLGLTDQRRR